MDVAGAATAGSEQSIGWWRSKLDERCWASSIRARGNVLGVDASDVSCAATAGVVVIAGGNGGMWLGDLIGRHFAVGFTNW